MAKKGKRGKQAATDVARSGSGARNGRSRGSMPKTKEYHDLMGETEITALGNPYFADGRNPRYKRIYGAVAEKDV